MGIKLKVTDATIHLRNATTVIHDTEDGQAYEGSYEVTPKVTREQTLETKRKVMKDNVTVHKLPQFEVSNEAGGYTLILGDEYYE